MTDTPFTLKAIFCADTARPAADGLDLTAVTVLIEATTAALPRRVTSNMLDAFRHALDEVLQFRLGDVLQDSWSKMATLVATFEATRRDPNSVAIVPLLEHTIASTHKPHIDLMYGGKSLGQIAFDITLNLTLKGVALEIRQGRIAGLKAGVCVGHGVFAFGGKPLIDRTTPELALPGRIGFTRQSQKLPENPEKSEGTHPQTG